jgi:hypothetical protein
MAGTNGTMPTRTATITIIVYLLLSIDFDLFSITTCNYSAMMGKLPNFDILRGHGPVKYQNSGINAHSLSSYHN